MSVFEDALIPNQRGAKGLLTGNLEICTPDSEVQPIRDWFMGTYDKESPRRNYLTASTSK